MFIQAQWGDEKKMSRSTDPLAHRVSLKFEDHPFLLELTKKAFLQLELAKSPFVTATSEKWPFVIDSVPIWKTTSVPEVGLNVQ